MAFLESDRVQIRMFLGYSALYLQADPRLESAITAIQSTTDGGTRPDSSSETQAKSLITSLQGIDTSLNTLDTFLGAVKADEATLSTVREDMRLRMKGRALVHRLGRIFDTRPRADIFGPAESMGAELPYDRSWARGD